MTEKAANSTRWIWLVKNWKYNVDQSSHWFKKLYFHWVFLPFNRLSNDVFNLVPPCARDGEGRLCWLEDQVVCAEEWQAAQEAAKYPFGQAVRVPEGFPLPADTVRTTQLSPNSPDSVQAMYKRNGAKPTVELPRLDLVQLAGKIAQTDALVEQFHSKAV